MNDIYVCTRVSLFLDMVEAQQEADEFGGVEGGAGGDV